MKDSTAFKDFWKWGDPAKAFHLNDFPKLKAFLEERWKLKLTEDFQPSDLTQVISDSTFNENDFKKIFPELKPDQFSSTKEDRIKYGFGKSYHDIIRIFTGKIPPLPDFVLFPETENDVEQILKSASRHQIQIIPFSGGSNVTGAFEMSKTSEVSKTSDVCCMNLQRMRQLIEIDEISHTATFESGIFGSELEKILKAKGFTLGHFPQSFEYSTLGGWLATRSGGQESGQYGKIEDMVLGIRAVTPNETIDTKAFPRHASGIDTWRLFIGSEGTLGVITQARLGIHQLPTEFKWVVSLFRTFIDGMAAIQKLLHAGIHPGIMRLSDPLETKLFSTMRNTESSGLKKMIGSIIKSRLASKGYNEPSILMMRFAIRNSADDQKAKSAKEILKSANGFLLPSSAAGNWEEHRFTLPYLRDTLIEQRVMIDTFETIAYWKDVSTLYSNVKESLKKSDFYDKGGLLFCHVSHVYESGACLYFTMIAPMERGNEENQWMNYKSLVTDAIVQTGGAVSHHHGVGKDHQKWYLQTIGEGERKLLQAIKKHLDPNDIMNPGKLFDEPQN